MSNRDNNHREAHVRRFRSVCAAVGGVFYSEQQFVNAGMEGDELAALSGQQAVARFGEFIRNFQEDRTTNLYPYA
jgi:hypothetical protein